MFSITNNNFILMFIILIFFFEKAKKLTRQTVPFDPFAKLSLSGLSELSFDPRPEIRESALQVLFDTLRNYGRHFSLALWGRVFDSVLFPIFDYVRHASDSTSNTDGDELDQDSWLYETCTLALQLVMDLFVNFYDTVNPLLEKVLSLLVSFIKRPHQSLAGIGIAAFVRLMSSAGEFFTDDKWLEVVLSLKEAANATLPHFSFVLNEDIINLNHEDVSKRESNDDSLENLQKNRLYAAISDAKCHAAVQLLLIQVSIAICLLSYWTFSLQSYLCLNALIMLLKCLLFVLFNSLF